MTAGAPSSRVRRSPGAESLADHAPPARARRPAAAALIQVLEASGLLGRGGAGFPVAEVGGVADVPADAPSSSATAPRASRSVPRTGRSWRLGRTSCSMGRSSRPRPSVPRDRAVRRGGHGSARAAIGRLAERLRRRRRAVRSRSSRRAPRPPTSPARNRPRSTTSTPATRGRRRSRRDHTSAASTVGRRSSRTSRALAHVALIAPLRRRLVSRARAGPTRGTALMTVGGAVDRAGVREIAIGTPIGEVAASPAPAGARDPQAVLLGGYFGGWVPGDEAWDLPLDPAMLRSRGAPSVAASSPSSGRRCCGVDATARILDFMAGQRRRNAVRASSGFGPSPMRRRASRPARPDATTLRGSPVVGAARRPRRVQASRWRRALSSALRVFGRRFRASRSDRTCARRLGRRAA